MHFRNTFVIACLLTAATPFAQASDRCALSANRDLDLNLAGVKTVVFDIGPHMLNLKGDASDPATGSVRAQACASDAARLGELVVTESREGDKLIVRAERNRLAWKGSWSGQDYGTLALRASVPAALAVQVKLGSGEARVAQVASLTGDVGSGELHASGVRGMFFADVGSGGIVADGVGGLHVVSVGSGDVSVKNVGKGASVGTIGSGELSILSASGDVRIESIGSGDALVGDIAGDLLVGRIGSGELAAERVRGSLTVRHIGSGSVQHREIGGALDIPEDH